MRIGAFDSTSMSPCASKCATRPRRVTTVTAPGISLAAMYRCTTSLTRCRRSDERPTSSGRPLGTAAVRVSVTAMKAKRTAASVRRRILCITGGSSVSGGSLTRPRGRGGDGDTVQHGVTEARRTRRRPMRATAPRSGALDDKRAHENASHERVTGLVFSRARSSSTPGRLAGRWSHAGTLAAPRAPWLRVSVLIRLLRNLRGPRVLLA